MLRRMAVMAVLLALPTMAVGQDWKGYTNDWSDPANWSGDVTGGGFYTNRSSIDPGDMAPGGVMPVIADGMSTTHGWARIRNGAVITQTGGFHEWINGTGDSNVSFFTFNNTLVDISGGTHRVFGRANIGYNGVNPSNTGTNEVRISGTGVFEVQKPFYQNVQLYDLNINTNSRISIADAGKLIVDASLQSKIDTLLSSGRIVAAQEGYHLETRIEFDVPVNRAGVRDLLIVSAVPEPASLLLLVLGGLMSIRRRKA